MGSVFQCHWCIIQMLHQSCFYPLQSQNQECEIDDILSAWFTANSTHITRLSITNNGKQSLQLWQFLPSGSVIIYWMSWQAAITAQPTHFIINTRCEKLFITFHSLTHSVLPAVAYRLHSSLVKKIAVFIGEVVSFKRFPNVIILVQNPRWCMSKFVPNTLLT